ncbi:MAG: hypothetical protein LH629_05870 [Ignavibacteria bacterium]|nr:hypothetical protein [Ignavibacteria bacterium]
MKRLTIILFLFVHDTSYSQNFNYYDIDGDIRCAFIDSSEDSLYLAGSFYKIDGVKYCKVAKWQNNHWDSLSIGIDYHPIILNYGNPIYAMTKYENKILVGGSFQKAGTSNSHYLASWDGTTWESFQDLPNGSVQDLQV